MWSTKIAPFFMPAKAPSAPMVTARRSLSLPTQHITKSWPSAAAFGVAAVLAAELSAQAFALAAVRLYTVTSWPPLFDQMSCHRETHDAETEKSDFGHVCYLGVLPATLELAGRCSGGEPHHNPCAGEGNAFVWRGGRVLC